MNFEFTPHAWEDFMHWVDNDTEIASKVNDILRSIRQTPFKDLGKPEALKHDLKGFWSRRITKEHRLVYRVSGKRGEDQKCSIIQCRYHYDD